jgi:hypothetical protein
VAKVLGWNSYESFEGTHSVKARAFNNEENVENFLYVQTIQHNQNHFAFSMKSTHWLSNRLVVMVRMIGEGLKFYESLTCWDVLLYCLSTTGAR